MVPAVAQVVVLLGSVVPVPQVKVIMVVTLARQTPTHVAVVVVLRLLVGVGLVLQPVVEALVPLRQLQALQSHALAAAVVGRYITLLQRREVPAVGVTVVLTQQ